MAAALAAAVAGALAFASGLWALGAALAVAALVMLLKAVGR